MESRSYFGELWLDPDPERFLYPLFYTVCMINSLFCALKLRKIELVLSVLGLTHCLWERGLSVSYLLINAG